MAGPGGACAAGGTREMEIWKIYRAISEDKRTFDQRCAAGGAPPVEQRLELVEARGPFLVAVVKESSQKGASDALFRRGLARFGVV